MQSVLEWVMGSPNSQAGAIDVIAVRKPDGSISCSPFHVKVAQASKKGEKKIVKLRVNGKDVDLSMKVGPAGEAFFVERTREFSRRDTPAAANEDSQIMNNIDTGDLHSPRDGTEDTCSPPPLDAVNPISTKASKDNLVGREEHQIAEKRLSGVSTAQEAQPAGAGRALRASRPRSYSESDALALARAALADAAGANETKTKPGSRSEKTVAHAWPGGDPGRGDGDGAGGGRRGRATSDMSELVLSAAQRKAAASKAPAPEGVDTQREIDRAAALNDGTDVSADTHPAGAHDMPVDEAAVAWMWRWGTLPVKKKSKASTNDLLQHQGHVQQQPAQSSRTSAEGATVGGQEGGQEGLSTAGRDMRGRAVSLPVLYRDDGSGSTSARVQRGRRLDQRSHRHRSSLSRDQGSGLKQLVTAVEADIPTSNAPQREEGAGPAESLQDTLLDGASPEEVAQMFEAASADCSTYKALSLCGHLLGDGQSTAAAVQAALLEHLLSPRDIAADPGVLRSADLVVVVGDYLLPLGAAETLLRPHHNNSSEAQAKSIPERRTEEAVTDEEVAAVLADSGQQALPHWAGRRIFGEGIPGTIQASPPGGVSDTFCPVTRSEAFSDLLQAYRVQNITSLQRGTLSGCTLSGYGSFTVSPLLQELIPPGGNHLASYHELWQRQQSMGRGASFTALLTLDAGNSTSLYEPGTWALSRSRSEDADGGYGVGYALHAEHQSDASGSQHSLPMLISLESAPDLQAHAASHDLPGGVRADPAASAPSPRSTAATAATSPAPPPRGYMHDAPERSLRGPTASGPSLLNQEGGGSSQPSVFDEGDTDNDNLSLLDIDLEDISPEPAGGDFYDSDTDSYLSLSLDDGESGGGPGSGKAGFLPVGATGHPSADGAAFPRRRFKRYRYRKVLVPSQEQLESLDLRDGPNDIVFLLDGCAPLKCSLFVWPADAKAVVTDLEGIFCRSSPQSGRNSGVWISFLGGGSYYSSTTAKTEFDSCIRLFAGIHKQGYRVIYLAQGAQSSGPSASSLLSSQEYLASFKATTGVSLPPGPVFKSPDSLVRAFGAARTEVFKASALRGVKSLFPTSHNPYHACFCTRETDALPFARFGFPEGRIFVVSEKREIKCSNRTCLLSFPQLNELLHQVFPFVRDSQFEVKKPTTGPADSVAAAGATSSSVGPGTIADSTMAANATTATTSTTLTVPAVQPRPGRCTSADDSYSDFNYWKIPPTLLEDDY